MIQRHHNWTQAVSLGTQFVICRWGCECDRQDCLVGLGKKINIDGSRGPLVITGIGSAKLSCGCSNLRKRPFWVEVIFASHQSNQRTNDWLTGRAADLELKRVDHGKNQYRGGRARVRRTIHQCWLLHIHVLVPP